MHLTYTFLRRVSRVRTSVPEALGSAKAVLNGADFSLLQRASRRSGFMAKN